MNAPEDRAPHLTQCLLDLGELPDLAWPVRGAPALLVEHIVLAREPGVRPRGQRVDRVVRGDRKRDAELEQLNQEHGRRG